MTVAATYSSTTPLQAKRVWHGDVVDRLLLLWPVVAVATSAALLWLFGLAVGAAIAFGLLAGCAVALAWTFLTLPFARLRDGLTTYMVEASDEAGPRRPNPPVAVSRQDVIYLIAAFHR